MNAKTSTYLVIQADGQSALIDAYSTYDAMHEVTKVLENEGVKVERFKGSAKVSAKKAQEAIENGARDMRITKPVIATTANRKILGALIGM